MPTKRLPSSIRRRGFLGGVVAASAGAFVAPPVRAQAVARAAERTDAAPSHVTFRSAEHMIGSAVNFA